MRPVVGGDVRERTLFTWEVHQLQICLYKSGKTQTSLWYRLIGGGGSTIRPKHLATWVAVRRPSTGQTKCFWRKDWIDGQSSAFGGKSMDSDSRQTIAGL